MKPLIGINVDVQDGPPPKAQVYTSFYEAIEQAGGIPLLIPPLADADLDQLITILSGVIMIGGDDYSPALYGEEKHPSVELVHPKREDFDMRLVQRMLKEKDIPLLGICGGLQALNIALGGSLIQDIPSQMPESKVNRKSVDGWRRGWSKHTIRISPETKLAKIYQRLEIQAVANNHQGLKTLGKGLTAVAFAEDEIVEAVELTKHSFIIGVQWHAERDMDTNMPLFREFVMQSALVGSRSR
jgi:putative glutamine amidotransferase